MPAEYHFFIWFSFPIMYFYVPDVCGRKRRGIQLLCLINSQNDTNRTKKYVIMNNSQCNSGAILKIVSNVNTVKMPENIEALLAHTAEHLWSESTVIVT